MIAITPLTTRVSTLLRPQPSPSPSFRIKPDNRVVNIWGRKCKGIKAPILLMGQAEEEAISPITMTSIDLSMPILNKPSIRINFSNQISQTLNQLISNASQDSTQMILTLGSPISFQTRTLVALNASPALLAANLHPCQDLVQVEDNNSKDMEIT